MKWKDINNSYIDQLTALKEQDPYQRLGIHRGATLEQVKAAYRRKMRLYHPDRTDTFMATHGEEISKLLNQAVVQIKQEISQCK